MGREKVAAVELVPEHAVKIRSGLVHQAEGEGVLVVDACGQEAVFPRFRRAGNVHDAEIVLNLFQHLPGLGCPGGDDHGVGRDDEVSARLLRRLHQPGCVVRGDVVIAVHELDVLTAGQLEAEVAGVGHAGVGLVHQQDAAVLFAELLADGQALVLGAVVDDDDLEILILLGTDAAKTAVQMALGIVHRQDDADEGHFHSSFSFYRNSQK